MDISITQTFHSSSGADCQSGTCVNCQKPFTQLCSTEMLEKGFSPQFVCCSPQCKKTLTHITHAFVQGFMVSWVLCYCYCKTDKDVNCDIDVCCQDVLQQATDFKNDKHLVIMKESDEGRSSVNGNFAVLPETVCKVEKQFEIEEHDITMPVYSETDSFPHGSSDCHMKSSVIETELNTSGADKFELQSLQSVSDDKNPVSTISPSPRSEQIQHSHERLSHVLNGIDAKKAKIQQNLKADGDRSMSSLDHKQNLCCTCPYCNKAFSNKRLLNKHTKSHHHRNCSSEADNQQGFACEFCAQIFMNRYSLKAHIRRKHSGEEPVECDICGKVQAGTFALSAHKKACHDFSSLCHICGAAFSGRTSFDKHMASHQGIKRYFCDVCGAGFVHNSSLNNHKAVHVTTKSFQCDICSQMFKVQYLLNEHLLKTHQSGPSLEHRIRGLKKMGIEVNREAINRHANHQCIVCGELLVEGVCPSHTDNSQEVFHCPTCGDMTSNVVLFYQHVKWHKGTLLSHNRRTSVGGDIPTGLRLSASGSASGSSSSVIKCEVCSKTFKNFEYLSAHMHQHREARFVCDICNKRFTYKCNLKTHMNTHLDTWQFECQACQKKFRDKYALKKHQLKHIEPQFKCEVCQKALTRRPYLIRHYQKMHPDYQQST